MSWNDRARKALGEHVAKLVAEATRVPLSSFNTRPMRARVRLDEVIELLIDSAEVTDTNVRAYIAKEAV